jgi:hypothetical protein
MTHRKETYNPIQKIKVHVVFRLQGLANKLSYWETIADLIINVLKFNPEWTCTHLIDHFCEVALQSRGRRGRHRMVVGFTTTCVISAYITTKVVSSNPVYGEVFSMQHYVIKFVSDLRQVGGILRFPPPNKLTTTI